MKKAEFYETLKNELSETFETIKIAKDENNEPFEMIGFTPENDLSHNTVIISMIGENNVSVKCLDRNNSVKAHNETNYKGNIENMIPLTAKLANNYKNGVNSLF